MPNVAPTLVQLQNAAAAIVVVGVAASLFFAIALAAEVFVTWGQSRLTSDRHVRGRRA